MRSQQHKVFWVHMKQEDYMTKKVGREPKPRDVYGDPTCIKRQRVSKIDGKQKVVQRQRLPPVLCEQLNDH
jgi:hypothetical protein